MIASYSLGFVHEAHYTASDGMYPKSFRESTIYADDLRVANL
jgi:hypothetical protein